MWHKHQRVRSPLRNKVLCIIIDMSAFLYSYVALGAAYYILKHHIQKLVLLQTDHINIPTHWPNSRKCHINGTNKKLQIFSCKMYQRWNIIYSEGTLVFSSMHASEHCLTNCSHLEHKVNSQYDALFASSVAATLQTQQASCANANGSGIFQF